MKDLRNIINSNIFTNKPPNNKFQSFKEARVYFNSKFSYEKMENLFKFHVPKCFEDTYEEEYFEEENMFKISMSDIDSCFEEKHLTKGLIDFLLSCFNFGIDYDISDGSAPSPIFGPVQSLDLLAPSPKFYADIFNFLKILNQHILIIPQRTTSQQESNITTSIILRSF